MKKDFDNEFGFLDELEPGAHTKEKKAGRSRPGKRAASENTRDNTVKSERPEKRKSRIEKANAGNAEAKNV